VRTYALGFTPAFAAIAPTGELRVTDTDAGRVVAYDAAAPEGTPPAKRARHWCRRACDSRSRATAPRRT